MTSPADKRTILVVDDEPHIVSFTSMNLEVEGFNVATARNGEEALDVLHGDDPVDLIVLDVMMPKLDGFETLRRIRSESSVPVIFVTVRGDESDRVAGLDLGADDYLTKPFSPRELVSRIRALFRRIEAAEPPRLQEVVVDDWLTINFDQSQVVANGTPMHLRPTEYRLLYQLVNNAGQLLSHDTLLERVWGPEYRGEHQYVRTYVTYLRQKLEKDHRNPEYILSERGLGYRFKDLNP
ncbi:Probable transcriptional regulator ycf27 [Geodia barretti]|jgi:DNA-binding response OmpR family regulator|uniref:Probable transcriptional regulator ycf27 n=1 Tax=Geodia barretti TaxID=519541 RepID=A0AA35W1L5_GEOBA|nr:Probable transcriptional regulator ycf27 [Geodia barretti]